MDKTVAYRSLQAGEMLNWYRIERILGRGGFGIIYLATDTNLDHTVAIKEYRAPVATTGSDTSAVTMDLQERADAGLQRFIDEARNLVRFRHPNIVRVMSVFELNNTAYMVMEFVEGHDLRRHLSVDGNATESALKSILVPITEGLSLVHASGFIHRDIKPANIMVRTDGSPVLLDFGSARNATPLTADSMTALVSAGYSPLEQYSGKNEESQGPWTDIYALGAVLYFAVTGVEPVDSAQRGTALFNGGKDPLIPARMLARDRYTASFLEAIDWALQPRIANRPQSLEQWLPALLAPIQATADRTVSERDQVTRRVPDNIHAEMPVLQQVSTGHEGGAAPSPAHVSELDTPDKQSRISADPLDGLSMRDQPVPREVEAARSRRSGRQPARLLLWSSVCGLLLAASVWLLQGWFDSALDTPLADNVSAPALAEQERLNAEAAAEQSKREREQALVAQRKAEEQAAARAAAVLAAEQASARRQEEAEKLAQEQAASLAAQNAAQVAARNAEKEAAEKAAADAQAMEAARDASQAADQAARRERALRLTRELDNARTQLEQGLLNQAAESLDRAAALSRTDARLVRLRTELQAAVKDARTPVSDDDFDYVIERFDALRRALESNDVQSMQALTIESDQNALFEQLMASFATLDIRINRIRVRNVDKSISATLRIETMVRANGDRATPSPAYRERTITSRRVQGKWSLIHW